MHVSACGYGCYGVLVAPVMDCIYKHKCLCLMTTLLIDKLSVVPRFLNFFCIDREAKGHLVDALIFIIFSSLTICFSILEDRLIGDWTIILL